jgi:hypothetical protein
MTADPLAARFAALADPLDDADWLDVRRRAGHRRVRARVALPLAAALVALVLGSAFAYYRDVVDFFGAEKAPRRAVADFESLDVGAPPGMAPGAIASETRRIDVPGLNSTRRVVFVAPTKAGGFCFVFREEVGGCNDGTAPLGHSLSARSIWGHTDPHYVASVELHFADGSELEPPITWVSPPIDHGFFFHTWMKEQELTSIVALDEDGELVTQVDLGRPRTVGPPPDAVFEERAAAVEVSSRSGRAVMWLAPTRYGRECVWLDLEERHDPYCSLPFHVRSTPQTVLIYGRVGEDDATIDLRYADGDTDAVRAEDGIFLFEIAEEHLDPGTALQSIGVRSADLDKEPWLSTTLGRGNSCRALPQPVGHSCPFAPGPAD